MDIEVAQVRARENSIPVGEVAGELLRGADGVSVYQHRRPPVLVADAQPSGQLRQRHVEHGEVIGGGVRPGPPGTQQLRDWLPSSAGAVVDEPEQRMKPEPSSAARRVAGYVRGITCGAKYCRLVFTTGST